MPRLLRSTFLAFLLSAIGLSLSFSPVYAQDKPKKCAEPYGTLAVVEPQDEVLRMLSKYALSSPTSLIRIMVQESNCFLAVERGVAMQNLKQERALAESGQLRGDQNVGSGQMVAADFILTPDVLISDDNDGGVGALGRLGRRRGLGLLAAGLKFKKAETSLLISDTRSGIQVAAAQGKAKKTDFRVGMLGVGSSTAIAGGGYTDTEEGKVIAANFLDNFNNVVASLEGNSNMDQYGASGDDTATAGEVFAAGDVVVAKIDDINLLVTPKAGAEAVGSVTSADQLVYLGTEENGYLQVQSSSGQGWINKLLVTKR
jgi:hypothetical protein